MTTLGMVSPTGGRDTTLDRMMDTGLNCSDFDVVCLAGIFSHTGAYLYNAADPFVGYLDYDDFVRAIKNFDMNKISKEVEFDVDDEILMEVGTCWTVHFGLYHGCSGICSFIFSFFVL